MPVKIKTIFTVFCGRQRYLSILVRFVMEMLSQGTIDECHLWDYTRSLQDYKYLSTLSKIEHVKVVPVKNKTNFGEYYQFYAAMSTPMSTDTDTDTDTELVLIKADDDIVYIDVKAMPAFIAYRVAHPEQLFCFPAIINNGLCAHYMQQQGTYVGAKIPTCPPCPHTFECNVGGFETLVADGKKALWLHNWFLSTTAEHPDAHTDAGILIPLDQRMSINMFAILAKDLHLLAHPGVTADDEKYLSVDMPTILGRKNSVFPGMVVSHFAFSPQRETGLDGEVEINLLAKYEGLAASMLLKVS